MLRVITGNPGSGKTFYAMSYLFKFCTYDKFYKTMILDPSVLIVSNIDGLKLAHMSVESFWNQQLYKPDILKEYLQTHSFKRVLFICDESQRYFAGLRDNEQFYFFEYHRHLGIDCFLICPSIVALPRRLVELSEYIIEAVPRSYSMGSFRYQNRDPKTGEKLYHSNLPKNKQVFELYRSFDVAEAVKPKNILLKKWIIGVLIIAFALVTATKLLSSGWVFGVRDRHKTEDKKIEKVQKLSNTPTLSYFHDSQGLSIKEVKRSLIKGYYLKTKGNLREPNALIAGSLKAGDDVYLIYRPDEEDSERIEQSQGGAQARMSEGENFSPLPFGSRE